MQYAIMYNPGHNRVYFESSLKLSIAEFEIVAEKLSVKYDNLKNEVIYGVNYLIFTTEAAVNQIDVGILSRLSFIYALFSLEEINNQIYLKPIEMIKEDYIDEGISSLLKYTGKTNEMFTRMLINIAYFSQSKTEGIRLLDPLAGKGTTLFEGIVKGFDVYGIEIGENVVAEASNFLKRFLESQRYKYLFNQERFSGPNRSFSVLKHIFKIARTKEELKAKETKTVEILAGNSMYVDKIYPKEYFDILVSDLPYGVQHGSVTNEKQSSQTRNPYELLRTCLPSWIKVLKITGVMVLSFNNNILSRKKIEQLLELHNLKVFADEMYLQLEHRVDQAIQRDVIVAYKDI